jgi:hypothetical protein
MFKIFNNSRFKIQELYEGHWLAYDVLNSTYKLKDFIHIVEDLYFYNKRRGCKYRVFDYELGKVVYE